MIHHLLVARVETLAALLALEPEWRRLESAAKDKLPFLTFDWVTSWWEHLSGSKRGVKDSLFVRSIRDEDGELVAVAPLMLTERPAVGPLRVRAVQFFGADPNITEIRGLLASEGQELAAQAALQEDLMACSDEWDWVQWTGVRAESPSAELLDQSSGVRWHRDVPNFVLPLEATWDAQRAQFGRNLKESVRKCYNSLKRDGHTISFTVVENEDEIEPALDEFFRLHHARSELADTIHHPDVFGSAAAHDFLVDVCRRSAQTNSTRIFQLRIGGQVVATRIGFVMDKTLYLYYSGYDPAWRKYSVSTTVVVEAIKYAITSGFDEVNLSTGNDVSKTRWGPRETVYREAHVPSDNWRGALALSGYHLALRSDRGPMARFTRPLLGRRASSL